MADNQSDNHLAPLKDDLYLRHLVFCITLAQKPETPVYSKEVEDFHKYDDIAKIFYNNEDELEKFGIQHKIHRKHLFNPFPLLEDVFTDVMSSYHEELVNEGLNANDLEEASTFLAQIIPQDEVKKRIAKLIHDLLTDYNYNRGKCTRIVEIERFLGTDSVIKECKRFVRSLDSAPMELDESKNFSDYYKISDEASRRIVSLAFKVFENDTMIVTNSELY